MGPVHLTVADIGRSLQFYREAIGLRVLGHEGARAELGTPERTLLVLTEVPGARPADGHTGLFHFALLVPEREDLARWLAHAARTGVQLTGASDHYVSEALYLRDPDHHGIEIYRDRERETWEGAVAERMGSWPLDLQGLLDTVDDPAAAEFDGVAAGTVMGHVHLRVADVQETTDFYAGVLGFDVMAHMPSAVFLAAGGYHHHLGANVWESRGATPAPPGSATLQHATIVLPDRGAVDAAAAAAANAARPVEEDEGAPVVADPAGNRLRLVAA